MKYRNYKEDVLFNLSLKDSKLLTNIYNNNKNVDIIESCEILEYKITGKLIEELVEIHEFELKELGSTTIRFYIDSTNETFSKSLQKKFEKFKEKDVPLKYTLIALSYSVKKERKKIKQEKEGLNVKRTKIPKSIATLIQHSDLINCKNIKEIEEFKL